MCSRSPTRRAGPEAESPVFVLPIIAASLAAYCVFAHPWAVFRFSGQRQMRGKKPDQRGSLPRDGSSSGLAECSSAVSLYTTAS